MVFYQDYWESAAEVNEALQENSILETIACKETAIAAHSSNSRVILLSGLIAFLAVILSYLTLQILRST